WTSIVAASPLTSSGTITLQFAENATGVQRAGIITVAGQNLAVIQEGQFCGPFSLSVSSFSFSATGGRGSTDIVGQEGCPFTVSGLPGWITIISGATGIGNGTLLFQVAPLVDQPRMVTLTVAGLPVSIDQSRPQSDFS